MQKSEGSAKVASQKEFFTIFSENRFASRKNQFGNDSRNVGSVLNNRRTRTTGRTGIELHGRVSRTPRKPVRVPGRRRLPRPSGTSIFAAIFALCSALDARPVTINVFSCVRSTAKTGCTDDGCRRRFYHGY